MIFTENVSKSIVLVIRGTANKRDILADLVAEESEFLDGFSHKGMLDSAREILNQSIKVLQKAFEDHPDYRLVITGHSLGAGTAVLIAMSILTGKTIIDPNKIEIKVGSYLYHKN